MTTMLWVVVAAAGVLVLDRALLWMESRNWIYYRKSKAGRGASSYHLLELSSILDPSTHQVTEIRLQEEEQEDEAGDPPVDP